MCPILAVFQLLGRTIRRTSTMLFADLSQERTAPLIISRQAWRSCDRGAIVACWQIHMGRAWEATQIASNAAGKVTGGDPGAVLSSCRSHWNEKERTEEICRLLETEGYRKTPDEAKQYCKSGVLKDCLYPSDERAAELERPE